MAERHQCWSTRSYYGKYVFIPQSKATDEDSLAASCLVADSQKHGEDGLLAAVTSQEVDIFELCKDSGSPSLSPIDS